MFNSFLIIKKLNMQNISNNLKVFILNSSVKLYQQYKEIQINFTRKINVSNSTLYQQYKYIKINLVTNMKIYIFFSNIKKSKST